MPRGQHRRRRTSPRRARFAPALEQVEALHRERGPPGEQAIPYTVSAGKTASPPSRITRSKSEAALLIGARPPPARGLRDRVLRKPARSRRRGSAVTASPWSKPISSAAKLTPPSCPTQPADHVEAVRAGEQRARRLVQRDSARAPPRPRHTAGSRVRRRTGDRNRAGHPRPTDVEPEGAALNARARDCVGRYVDPDDLQVRPLRRQRERDRPAAGADIAPPTRRRAAPSATSTSSSVSGRGISTRGSTASSIGGRAAAEDVGDRLARRRRATSASNRVAASAAERRAGRGRAGPDRLPSTSASNSSASSRGVSTPRGGDARRPARRERRSSGADRRQLPQANCSASSRRRFSSSWSAAVSSSRSPIRIPSRLCRAG